MRLKGFRLLVGLLIVAGAIVPGLPAQAGDGVTRLLSIVPESPTVVGNCIPFGNNTRYGFTGFIYRSVPAFVMHAGDTIAFDLGARNDVSVRRDIYFAQANKNPRPLIIRHGQVMSQGIEASEWVQVVSDEQDPRNSHGNYVVDDYELQYRAEANFTFSGGGLIVGVASSPPADYSDRRCEQVLVSTNSQDSSGNFYARYCYQPHLSTGVLDEVGLCGGMEQYIGGITINAMRPLD